MNPRRLSSRYRSLCVVLMLLGLQFMSFLFVQCYQARDLEKELNEVKDRNAALQSQLTEYAGVISDQSKV